MGRARARPDGAARVQHAQCRGVRLAEPLPETPSSQSESLLVAMVLLSVEWALHWRLNEARIVCEADDRPGPGRWPASTATDSPVAPCVAAMARLGILAAAAWCFDLHLSFHAGAEPGPGGRARGSLVSISRRDARLVGEWIQPAETAPAQSAAATTREIASKAARPPSPRPWTLRGTCFPGAVKLASSWFPTGPRDGRDPLAEIPRLQEEALNHAVPGYRCWRASRGRPI